MQIVCLRLFDGGVLNQVLVLLRIALHVGAFCHVCLFLRRALSIVYDGLRDVYRINQQLLFLGLLKLTERLRDSFELSHGCLGDQVFDPLHDVFSFFLLGHPVHHCDIAVVEFALRAVVEHL